MKIYQSQKAYREKNKAWARTLEELGLPNIPPSPGSWPRPSERLQEAFEGRSSSRQEKATLVKPGPCARNSTVGSTH